MRVEPKEIKVKVEEKKIPKPKKKNRSRSANMIASLFGPGDEIPEKPLQPPQIRGFSLGSKGELGMKFSGPVEFPESLKKRFE